MLNAFDMAMMRLGLLAAAARLVDRRLRPMHVVQEGAFFFAAATGGAMGELAFVFALFELANAHFMLGVSVAKWSPALFRVNMRVSRALQLACKAVGVTVFVTLPWRMMAHPWFTFRHYGLVAFCLLRHSTWMSSFRMTLSRLAQCEARRRSSGDE